MNQLSSQQPTLRSSWLMSIVPIFVTLFQRCRDIDLFYPIRRWLSQLQIQTPARANFLCRMIPAQCPFARKIIIAGRKIAEIPPLCKLNPLYNELMELRFRALCYLAEEQASA
jgi:hypothetical protein